MELLQIGVLFVVYRDYGKRYRRLGQSEKIRWHVGWGNTTVKKSVQQCGGTAGIDITDRLLRVRRSRRFRSLAPS